MVSLQQHLLQKPSPYEMKPQDVKIRLASDVKVLSTIMEVQYDDKGNPIKMTKEMYQKVRAGLPAQIGDLRVGQYVQVVLAKPQQPKATKQTAAKNNKGGKTTANVADILGGSSEEEGGGGVGETLVDPRIPEALLVVIISGDSKQ
jgi:hypothetical protein